jgi:hypothetical protein
MPQNAFGMPLAGAFEDSREVFFPFCGGQGFPGCLVSGDEASECQQAPAKQPAVEMCVSNSGRAVCVGQNLSQRGKSTGYGLFGSPALGSLGFRQGRE